MNWLARAALLTIVWVMFVIWVVSSWKGSFIGTWVEPVVFLILLVTLLRGAIVGLWLSVLAGWIYDSGSIWPMGMHVLANMLAVLSVVVILRFWLTARSRASFFVLIPLGTAICSLTLVVMPLIMHLLSPASLVPNWGVFVRAALMQIGVHAVLALMVLQFRRNRYMQAELGNQF